LSSSGQRKLEALDLLKVAGPASELRGGWDIGAHEMNVRPVREAVARLRRSELEGR
jgi:hypothetical protein